MQSSRRAKLIEALRSAPRDLERLLRPVSAEQALRRPDDDWCVADVVAHLAYVEERFQERFRRVLTEDQPRVPYIHPDASAHELERPIGEQFARFQQRRNTTLSLLEGLSQADWARTLIRESDGGASTLRDQVQVLVDHDSAHLSQLVALRRRLEQA
jgi:uncharacterized damage-inducible protein DinB